MAHVFFSLFTSVFSKLKLYLSFNSVFSPRTLNFWVKKWTITASDGTCQRSSSKTMSSCVSTPNTAVTVTVTVTLYSAVPPAGPEENTSPVLFPILLTDIQYQSGMKCHFSTLSQTSHLHLDKI